VSKRLKNRQLKQIALQVLQIFLKQKKDH